MVRVASIRELSLVFWCKLEGLCKQLILHAQERYQLVFWYCTENLPIPEMRCQEN